jgi:hypothetical protein
MGIKNSKKNTEYIEKKNTESNNFFYCFSGCMYTHDRNTHIKYKTYIPNTTPLNTLQLY